MTRHSASWVCEEMSSDSDICALFMSVSEVKWEKEKAVDTARGGEVKRNGDEEGWLVHNTKGRGSWVGGGGAEERQVVYCRYPSKTNLYCIKISRW